jgi:enoyl-CoA hydratase
MKTGREAVMSLVVRERKGAAVVLTYANPPWGTMTAAGARELYSEAKIALDDPAVRCLILTGGVPGIFIRHYDVDELADMSARLQSGPPPSTPRADAPPPSPGFLELTDMIAAADKPVVAAINGLCQGGGFELALACDLRIAAPEAASIGLPETRIGIFPGGGGTQRLPRVVGEAKALEIILRGLTFTGAEAHAIGLVHELAADPLARALEMAREWEGRGAEGIAAAKRLTRAALDRPLSEGLSEERRSFQAVMRTASARLALEAARRPVEIQKI